MTIYLHDIPLDKAQARLEMALKDANLWRLLGFEEIALNEQALDRILAKPVWAKISSPHYHSSAMDGFALHASATEGALQTSPLTLIIGSNAVYVNTGNPLPDWANAVIPIENVEPVNQFDQLDPESRNPYAIRIRAAVPPWSHVRPMGEDMVATQLVIPAGQILRPVDLGAIAGCGHNVLYVARRPRVAILPTGGELIPIGQPPRAGDIIEYNSIVLAAQIQAWGGKATRYSITPDKFEQIQARVVEAAKDHDLILLNAGSSAGSEDFSAAVVDSLGEVLVHGVAVRPGHPVILGMIDIPENPPRKIPIIGVPGYPVSAALTGEIFVEPLIACWLGRRASQPLTTKATLTRKMTSPAGDDDYVRVAVGQVGKRMLAAPLARGSGVISSLVRADGIVIVPSGSQGLPAGEQVTVRLYRQPQEIKRTIFIVGSHDMTLDIIAQLLTAYDRRLASSNVGSIGGLVALQRGEAHIAGAHLLDPESGNYNLSYINQYLPEVPVRLIALVGREQGLLVPKGNPKNLQSLGDLSDTKAHFINRQRGAGTRILLDYHLDQMGINSANIQGYEREEFTHLNVAATVASGKADCGLGIAAAAQALDLDFVPLFQERYDLIVPEIYYESALLDPLWTVLNDPQLKAMIKTLPGYDIGSLGKSIAVLNGN